MTANKQQPSRGIVYTFYSFKGGVGRTMALANVGYLLAKWGHKVLVVDWDLEAPGIERFFFDRITAQDVCVSKPGLIDLIGAIADGRELNWRDCVHQLPVDSQSLHIDVITAGRGGPAYIKGLHALNFSELFANKDLGKYIERLRTDWVTHYEFVLVDSRTGVNDIGGICTVHLADIPVLFFTSTESSTEGALEVFKRARLARESLPLDRGRLVAVPVPSRDESRTEYQRATEWKEEFARKFGDLYRDWLPRGTTPEEAIELLRIPYIPYWSFGESLPVKEATSDPASLGRAYERLARLLAEHLDWEHALKGEAFASPIASTKKSDPRSADEKWKDKNRHVAVRGLEKSSLSSFVEIYHFLVATQITVPQQRLRDAARESMITTFGWPIGVVLDRPESAPKATNQGIFAEISTSDFNGQPMYDYWALRKDGDFYTLVSLFEDNRDRSAIYFDTRIVRTTEALLHCRNIYRELGSEPNALVDLTIRHSGMLNRVLKSAGPTLRTLSRDVNVAEDESIANVTFRLSTLDSELVSLVESLCDPLFVLFNFAKIPHATYERLVSNFVAGKIG